MMKGRLFFVLLLTCLTIQLEAQCHIPDYTHCYTDNLTDEVIFEMCPSGANTMTAVIFRGEIDDGFDFLDIYSGSTGSGTSGTLLHDNLTGSLDGFISNPSNAGECLIFVMNSTGSVSCANPGGSPLKELQVFENQLPTYDVDYCYGNNETDFEITEICPNAGQTVTLEICNGTYELLFGDNLSIYEGTMGQGTGGVRIFGPAQGDLTGNIITTGTANNCMSIISNSDAGFSCGSGAEEHLYAHSESVLPIGLVNFTGKKEGATNVLTWQTHFELNNQYQTLQVSPNGFNEWKSFDIPDLASEDGDIKTYSVRDVHPLAKAYYRVKSVDYDGFTQYSSVVVLTRKEWTSPISGMSAYPNPTFSDLFIDLDYDHDEDLSASILDPLGRVMQATIFRMEEGSNTLYLSLAGLPVGQYYVHLKNSYVNVAVSVVKN